jgi:hypothetical protein
MLDIRPDSTANRFRAARVARLRGLIAAAIAEKGTARVIDVGGTYAFWHTWRAEVDWTRTDVTCVNLDPAHYAHGRDETRVTMMQGDACNLAGIADGAFDVAFSNSVIEHVGGWRQMAAMAAEVRRIAPRYLVQTPYFWFPVEPHARTPLLHWLPRSWAYRIVMARKCGFYDRARTVAEAMAIIEDAQMVDRRQMTALFPDATIVRERFLGLTKSLIAIRGGAPGSFNGPSRAGPIAGLGPAGRAGMPVASGGGTGPGEVHPGGGNRTLTLLWQAFAHAERTADAAAPPCLRSCTAGPAGACPCRRARQARSAGA